ncbi:MAG: 2-oxoisovalerate dehydrogenase E1 component beta subunit [Comamonadaceae bacterium]|nr:MAG: 2-oxoisovalerate dehydrogenase E1 component beta subunit [Comamonadaceae bacterium]
MTETLKTSPMTMIQALRSAMDVMLARDPNVVIYGQDVGYFGGVFRCTEGLQPKFGKQRVFDAPISEGGIVGTAVGMAAYGLRPVVEIQFADYVYPATDQIVSEAARLRYRRHLRRPDPQPKPRSHVHPGVRPAHGDAIQPL